MSTTPLTVSIPSSKAVTAPVTPVTSASPLCHPWTGSMSVADMGRLTHGDVAELHEGFRVLAGNNVVQQIGIKDLKEVLVSVGFSSTEDFGDIFRVSNQQCMADHLTFPEFVLLMTKEVDEKMQEELKLAFRQYDKGASGYVTTSQFCEMLATMGDKSTPEEVQDMMMFADPDGSGRIEYAKVISKLADKLRR